MSIRIEERGLEGKVVVAESDVVADLVKEGEGDFLFEVTEAMAGVEQRQPIYGHLVWQDQRVAAPTFAQWSPPVQAEWAVTPPLRLRPVIGGEVFYCDGDVRQSCLHLARKLRIGARNQLLKPPAATTNPASTAGSGS